MDMDNSVVTAGGKMGGTETWLGVWTHDTEHSPCVVELYTWNLCNFVSQCHPNKFSKKEKNEIQNLQL